MLAWASVRECHPTVWSYARLMAWTAAWRDQRELLVVRDAGYLTELLAKASQDALDSYTMIELVSPDGAALAVGLGREMSAATFQASAEPPYYVSRGTLIEG